MDQEVCGCDGERVLDGAGVVAFVGAVEDHAGPVPGGAVPPVAAVPVEEAGVPVHPVVVESAPAAVGDQHDGAAVLGVVVDGPCVRAVLRLGGERHPSVSR